MSKWEDDSMERYSPTVRKRRLGLGLRSLRNARSLTAEQVAKDLDWSVSQVTKIETAERNISKPALMGLFSYYKASQKEQRELLELHANSRAPGWFQPYGVQPGTFVDFATEAVKLQAFEPLYVPGLLQTEDYAETVIGAVRPELPHAEQGKRASVRAQLQSLLTEPDGPEIHYIIHEAALRTVVGGPKVMLNQLNRIPALCEQCRKLTVQVLPFDRGAYSSMDGAFTILTFSELAPLAMVEHILSASWFEKPGQLNTLTTAFGRLANQAMPMPESLDMIRELAGKWG
jgi:transcriptional regulator with XRE-family HTH domain